MHLVFNSKYPLYFLFIGQSLIWGILGICQNSLKTLDHWGRGIFEKMAPGTIGEFLHCTKYMVTGNRFSPWGKLGNPRGGDSQTFWGILGTNSPKIIKFLSGEGETITGEFGLTTVESPQNC